MIEIKVWLLIAGSLGLLYLLCLNLMNAYFRRKEKFVDQLNEKMKGSTNGQE